MAGKALPPDIDPVSRFRLPLPRREDLDAEAQKIYDSYLDSDGGSLVGLNGPGGIRLHSQKLAKLTSPLNRYLRRKAAYEPKIRELAILVTAKALRSQFEWDAHADEARSVELAPEVIGAVLEGGSVEGLPEIEALVITLGREAFDDREVKPETFARALAMFGPETLVDLVSLMGAYAATAVLLTVFDMQLPDGKAPPLPE